MHADHKYIEALRKNDPTLLREIYQKYSGEALRWVLNNNGSADDARDVFQEAVLALFEKARRTDFVLTCPMGALLHLIYSRKWIDRLREKKRELAVRKAEDARLSVENAENALFTAEDALRESETQARLGKAFNQLSELCRNLLSLLAQGMAPKDAALQLQLNSVDTLYRRKNACVQRWKTLFAELTLC